MSTEAVSCVLPDGRTTSTYASDGPRSEPLSVADIVQACTWRVDAVLDADTDPDQAQVCTAELRQDALDERRTTTDDTFLAGSWDDGTPVSPVVLLGGGDCTTQVIAGHLRTTETLSDRDLADINAARALEISFRADGCVDHETALASAEKARAAGGWPIATPTTPAGDGACSSVSFDEWGAIIVEPAPDTGP
ncbi:MAG: hypothetical protein WEB03_01980 [Nitriliruptor sp.]|uniref:hypothetical protein n=1 Tax=Nitriliruptor sp. TaxID=2448056 RepID=UPI0034A03BD5